MLHGKVMQLDWIQWNFFLKMLSAERTEPFVGELALPFEVKEFPKVMRLARSCWEFVIFQYPGFREERPESQNLVEAWRGYREVDGVLSETKLLEFEARYGGSLTAPMAIYSELHDTIGPRTSKALKNWFANNFRSGPDPVWQWPWALRLLLTDSDGKIIPATPAPLDNRQRHCLEEFCMRYRAEQDALEMRFYAIEQAAQATGASRWEKVLQNYPPEEGTLKYFPWLNSVEHCLQYRFIRYEWEKLRLELGSNVMTQLITWVRMNSGVLPFTPTLPDEPKPL